RFTRSDRDCGSDVCSSDLIADVRRGPGSVLVLPIVNRPRVGNLEAVEEAAVDGYVANGQVGDVNVDPSRGQTNRGALENNCFASDFRFNDGETLRERMVGVFGRSVRPQQVRQVITRKLFPGLQ